MSTSMKALMIATEESRFGNIYYTKRGHGSPVLLSHDALPGSSGYEWNKVDKLIATEHTVYTIDLLGYGRSDKSGIRSSEDLPLSKYPEPDN